MVNQDVNLLPPVAALTRYLYSVLYFTGGVLFFIGSVLFIPASFSDILVGAVCFITGTSSFIVADIYNIMHKNNENGNDQAANCTKMESTLPSHHSNKTHNSKTFILATISSFLGLTLYLIGSILFIPSFNQMSGGNIMYLIGGFFIATPQLVSTKNLITNIPIHVTKLISPMFTAIGAILYSISSCIYFIDDQSSFVWILSLIGGILFLIVGIVVGLETL